MCCAGYSIVALFLLFNPDSGVPAAGSNFVPFHTIRWQIRLGFLRQLIGNALLLAPIGFTLVIWGMRVRRTVAALLIVAVSIEVLQEIVDRVTDIDDVILNVSGGFGGALVGVAVVRAIRFWQERRQIV